MSDINDSLEMPPTILSFAKDLANLCSLAGLFSAVLAISLFLVIILPQ